MELDERVISLETKIAYLENYVSELNQVVLDQDRLIRKIISEIEVMKKKAEEEEKKEKLPENEKPPHY